ncbi:MAG TPA: HAD family hydrolase [Casimicrobiaceae bacterium]|nr:HAD family hydrolase [Casimicrobiaceae bacterium]
MEQAALFLDRDGVINVDKGHVGRIEDFEFLPGIFELCRLAQALRFLLVVVTNQAGIGRGLYSEEDFGRLTAWMLSEFRARGVSIARVYHCPYHPTAAIGDYRRESPDRKPNPGMLLRARSDFDLDLSRSVMIGDRDSDIAAGSSAGVGFNVKLVPAEPAAPSPGGLEFASLQDIGDWLSRTFAAGPESRPRSASARS